MKRDGGIIKHIQYFITSQLFGVHSPVILLPTENDIRVLYNGSEQSLEKPWVVWSQRRLGLVHSHVALFFKEHKNTGTGRIYFSCQIRMSVFFPSSLWYLLFVYNSYCMSTRRRRKHVGTFFCSQTHPAKRGFDMAQMAWFYQWSRQALPPRCGCVCVIYYKCSLQHWFKNLP